MTQTKASEGEQGKGAQPGMSNAAQDYAYYNQLVNEYRAVLERAEALREACNRLEHLDEEYIKHQGDEHRDMRLALYDQKQALRNQLKANFPELGPLYREFASQYREFGPNTLYASSEKLRN